MPCNKRTAQEIEGHIHELVDDNLKRTKNVDLELKFQKYQREKNKLDAFRLKLDQKKPEYSGIYLYNVDSHIQYYLKTSQHFHQLSVPISFKKYIIYFSKLIFAFSLKPNSNIQFCSSLILLFGTTGASYLRFLFQKH